MLLFYFYYIKIYINIYDDELKCSNLNMLNISAKMMLKKNIFESLL